MKLLRPAWVLCTLGLLLGGAWLVTADETQRNSDGGNASAGDVRIVPDRTADEQAIRQTAEAFAKAYNAGDAKAIAAEFIEDGEYIDEFKNIFKGRDAIEKEFAAFFAQSPGHKARVNVEEVRFIGPTMAIEEGVTSIDPDEGDDEPAVDSRYVAVHIKQNGKWRLAVARDLESDVPSPHEHLKQLEWLIGDWIDESKDATVRTSTRWSEDGNFILSRFHVEAKGVRTMDGSQRIGWDPVAKQIRSWVFDSEGGFAEGAWTRVGDEWLVKANGVRPDGVVASMTNVYSPLDGKTVRWSTTQRVVGGELQPDVSVVMVHQPPKAGSDTKN